MCLKKIVFLNGTSLCVIKYMDIADRDFLIATYIFKVYRQTRSTVFKVKRGRANSSKILTSKQKGEF